MNFHGVQDPAVRAALESLSARLEALEALMDGKTLTTKRTYKIPPGQALTPELVRALNKGME
jgi:hypothetical protein